MPADPARGTALAATDRPTAILAAVFGALGDPTRLALLTTLADGRPRSIADLTAPTRLTRQAVTRHLDILTAARLVVRMPAGRESRVVATPAGLTDAAAFLDGLAAVWAARLDRLRAHVED